MIVAGLVAIVVLSVALAYSVALNRAQRPPIVINEGDTVTITMTHRDAEALAHGAHWSFDEPQHEERLRAMLRRFWTAAYAISDARDAAARGEVQ